MFKLKATQYAQANQSNKELGHEAQPRFAIFITLVLSAAVAAILVLAFHTSVPQVTRAPGIIMPFGNYNRVESPDGGIIVAVFAHDGDTVARGDVLMTLNNPQLKQDANQLSEQLRATELRYSNALAIYAALQDRDAKNQMQYSGAGQQRLSQAAARLDVYYRSQETFDEKVRQLSHTVDILAQAATFAHDRTERELERLSRHKDLYERGLITRTEFDRHRSEADELVTQATEAEVDLARAQENLMAAITDRDMETLALTEETLKDIEALEGELATLRSSYEVVQERLARQDVVAPSNGILQSTNFASVGEVIEPGETLFDLLPVLQSLVVEAKIPAIEIGHVTTDQPVSVSFDSFDVKRHGKVEGRIVSFSPAPLTDEMTGDQYFRTFIELERSSVGEGAFERPIQAGLTTVAEIIIGHDSLLSYMLRPVERTLERAFTER